MKTVKLTRHLLTMLLVGGLALFLGKPAQGQAQAQYHLVFRSANSLPNESDYATLFQVNIETGETSRFLDTDHTYVVNMAWSPNGTKLAGLTLRNFTLRPSVQTPFDLCVFTAEGALHLCFEQVAAHHSASQPIRPQGWPIHWSEDSQYILFVSSLRDGVLGISSASIPDGTVKHLRDFSWADFGAMRYFSWHPDGNKIAVSVQPNYGMTDSIWVLDISSGQMTEKSKGEMYLRGPLWSPEGRYLAYTNDGLQVYDSQTEADLTPANVLDSYLILNLLSWSHSADTLVFEAYDNEALPEDYSEITPASLYTYNLTDGAVAEITHTFDPAVTEGAFSQLTWDSNDEYVAFSASTTSDPYHTEIMVLSLGEENQDQSRIYQGEGSTNQEPVWQLNNPIE
jgi:Tol biopolymer transport system component